MIKIERLKNNISQFLQFVPEIKFSSEEFAIGTMENDEPIGILLGRIDNSIRCVELKYIFVKEAYRNSGIATKMLALFEEETKKEGCSFSFCVYPVEKTQTDILEHIFAKMSWLEPELYLIQCRFNTQQFDPPWLGRQYTLPEDFTEFYWRDVKKEEKELIQHQVGRKIFQRNVSPLLHEDKIDFGTSLGLRYKNEIVGWVITHKIDQDTLRYSSLYIENRWQMTGAGLKLLNDSILLHKQGNIPWTLIEINLPEVEPTWLRFVKKHLMPYAQEVNYKRHIMKFLK